MFKNASAGGPSKAIQHPKNAPRWYWRKHYYDKIHSDFRLGRKFSARNHRIAPAWLLEEVTISGSEKWLSDWDRGTGLRKLDAGTKPIPAPALNRKPPPRAETRRFYYRVIETELGRFCQRYRGKAPEWLIAEVRDYTPQKWLARWDPKTGKKRAKAPRIFSKNSA